MRVTSIVIMKKHGITAIICYEIFGCLIDDAGVFDLKNKTLSKTIEKDIIIAKLMQYFKDKDVASLVFIFGSIVSGHMTEQSDIDIAVLFSHKPQFHEILSTKDEVCTVIGREIDLVVLNDSSPVIRMQVLKNGVLIVNKDRAIYNNFFVRTIKEYDDLKRLRKEIEENILRGRIYA